VASLIDQLKINNSGLSLSEIEGILYLIKCNSALNNNELIRLTGLPKETLKKFKTFLSNRLEDTESEEILINQEFAEELERLELKPYKWSVLNYENKDLEEKLKGIRAKYKLEPKRDFDQFFATEKTSVSKALIMADRGQISGKNIAMLGDDDLNSIVLGLMGVDYNSITVFDIDSDILGVIKRISEELNLKNIRTELLDVRKELKSAFLHKFDVVVTDPPYTKSGIALFLNASVKLLRESGYVFLYYGNSFKTPEKTIKIQEVINQFNFVVEDRINKFARYYGAESIGSASSLYVLKATPFTMPLEEVVLNTNIYTFENQKEEKFPFVDHYTFKIFGVPQHIALQKKVVLKITNDFCVAHRLKVVDTKVTQFKGKGLSITYILSTSNLLVHTWPELGAIHLDLITCAPIYNKDGMGETISKLFGTSNMEIRRIE
jgi:S-adenosylmethionine/arginine decarboxylase-like enzyme